MIHASWITLVVHSFFGENLPLIFQPSGFLNSFPAMRKAFAKLCHAHSSAACAQCCKNFVAGTLVLHALSVTGASFARHVLTLHALSTPSVSFAAHT